MTTEHAQDVILACCVMHNHLRCRSRSLYTHSNFSDTVEPDGYVVDGTWRDDISNCLPGMRRTNHRNPAQSAIDVQNHMVTYFDTVGRLCWQDTTVRRT